MKRSIKGIIFDLDGTLIDSFSLRVDSWHRALYMNGANVDKCDIEPLIGLPGISLASIFSDSPEKVETDEERIFRERIAEVGFFPDVIPTLGKLESMNVKWIIVTSARRSFVDLIPVSPGKVITVDDVETGKPDTEAYEKASEIMGIDPGEIMVVGDSINDIIPARAMGMLSVLVTHGFRKDIKIQDLTVKEISEIIQVIGEGSN
ncbi:MAG: HAD family hydrolase [Candidatus Thermoplasmatota archaeon]|jgi:HAD superfamily hydrolase (TIGR01509 family)|nr:HAD family hydrolase [Candidatus Thermoplasmatota archaeon]MCL5791155.1 HAD family hydrolase [Candidatus Thermoplasmatota archaeon]